MCKIITELNRCRLVTIIGCPGIGKTTLAKSVGLFLEERDKFRDGIIYISMSRRYQANMLISQLLMSIKKQMTPEVLESLNKMQKQKIKNESFENENNINQADLDKIIHCLSSRNVLIILDNIEDPLNQDALNLRLIMEQLLDKCEDIKFLNTSRSSLEKLGNNEEQLVILNELSAYWSVKLFFEKTKIEINLK